ncbi:MAG: RsmB/NOP family class I SAM-dependent RNA methyltransferase [Bacteroidota bacterium]
MKRSSLYGHIIELLDIIRSSRLPADNLVREFFRSRRYLGAADRRYISEQTYGILRRYRWLEAIVADALARTGSQIDHEGCSSLLFCAAHAVRSLGREPDEVRTDLKELGPQATPGLDLESFAGSLKDALPYSPAEESPSQTIPVEYSFPDFIVQEWLERFGVDETRSLCAALNRPAQTTIRVNTLKCSVDECRTRLPEAEIGHTEGRWAPAGLVLAKRLNIESVPAFRQGWFEMQDEGSQLLSHLLSVRQGECVVDACAGGGGKTLHLGALMQNRGTILSIDVDDRRLRRLTRRVRRAGVSISLVLSAQRQSDAIEQFRGKADAVLVDAPCSGVGTFRRNPGAKLLLTEDDVTAFARTQRRILERYSSLVRPGGRLLYATCTLLRRENEEIVHEFLSHHPEFAVASLAPVLEKLGIDAQDDGSVTLLPHRTDTDGFYACLMIKPA